MRQDRVAGRPTRPYRVPSARSVVGTAQGGAWGGNWQPSEQHTHTHTHKFGSCRRLRHEAGPFEIRQLPMIRQLPKSEIDSMRCGIVSAARRAVRPPRYCPECGGVLGDVGVAREYSDGLYGYDCECRRCGSVVILVGKVGCAACGWTGDFEDLRFKIQRGRHEYRCPGCSRTRLILNPEVKTYMTLQESRR